MSAVKINAPIAHPGTVGYLLWLRRDLPRTYLTVMQKVPAVASFERLLRGGPSALGCCLGDDAPTFDMSFDAGAASTDFSAATSAFDTSSAVLPELTVTAASGDPGVIDTSFTQPVSDASIVAPSIPQLPPIAEPSTSIWSQVGSAAAAVGQGVVAALPAVASIVKAAAPIAITAIQTNAALKGVAPYRTGYFVNPQTGQRYLSAVAGPRSTYISGNLPTWAIAAAIGAGVLLLAR